MELGKRFHFTLLRLRGTALLDVSEWHPCGGNPQVVIGLKVHPKLRSHTKVLPQAQRGVGADRARFAHPLCKALLPRSVKLRDVHASIIPLRLRHGCANLPSYMPPQFDLPFALDHNYPFRKDAADAQF